MRFLIKFILFINLTPVLSYSYTIPESTREKYGKLMNEAFAIQSLGRSTQAFYKSKEAYELAIKSGESVIKLNVIIELFQWYRKFGYSAGVMLNSSNCIDEYKSKSVKFFHPFSNQRSSSKTYNPEQEKHVRQFILGVGLFISGVFAISINPPFFGPMGKSLCTTGFIQMYLGLNNGYAEWQQRVREVQQIEAKTSQLPDIK